MVPPIPYYFISYNDSQDHSRVNKFKNKLERLKKVFFTDINIIKVNDYNQTNIKQGHIKAIKEGLRKKEKQIIILEDNVSFTEPTLFKKLTQIPFENIEKHTIIHFAGYLEEKQTEYESINNLKWIKGHSRSHFAYLVNLEFDDIKSNGNKWFDDSEKEWSQIIYKNSSLMYSEIIVYPFGYNLEKGLMKSTLDGLSICKFTELYKSTNELLKNPSEESQLSLNFYPLNITEDKLPRITLLTTVNDQRLWWALLRLNLDNFEYPTNKIKWIIIETTKLSGYDRGDTIEDILPKKRGTSGGWQLEYLQKEEWNGLDFLEIITKLKNESEKQSEKQSKSVLEGDFIVEFNPDVFYTIHSIISRVKVMLKYPRIKIAGTVQHQYYNVKSEKSYIIGNNKNLELDKDSRITRNSLNNYEFNFEDKIRIPSEFVFYKLGLSNNINNMIEYKKSDKFPDFLVSEDYFTNLIVICEDLKRK